MNSTILVLWLTAGVISTILFFFMIILFGRVFYGQMKLNYLSKRGYHLIEHIDISGLRSTFFLKPDKEHFNFEKGGYAIQGLPASPAGIVFRKLTDLQEKRINKLVFIDSARTLKNGIETLTYVEGSVTPFILKKDAPGVGAKRLSELYDQILLEIIDPDLQKILKIMIIIAGVVAIGLLLGYVGSRASLQNADKFCTFFNASADRLANCVANRGL